MPDPRLTVERIRAFVASNNLRVSDDVVELASDYADMCRSADIRLRRCGDFLREGLQSEAVAHAASKPPLLDLVVMLDFPTVDNWDRATAALGLAKPPRLSRQTIQELSDAQQKHEPLHDLLAKHRYLALARGPLRERIAVLRQLLANDPTGVWWRRDLEELERARFDEIRNETAAAMKSTDAASIDRLITELNTPGWKITPPAELKEALPRASAALHEAAALAELRAMVPTIREAYASRVGEACKQVFARWGSMVREHRLSVPPDLRQEIMPLAHWLDEQEDLRDRQRDFRAACRILAKVLESDASPEQVAPLYHQVTAFDMEIPGDLAKAYQESQESAERAVRAEKLWQYLLGALLGGIILLAVGVLIYVIVVHRKH